MKILTPLMTSKSYAAGAIITADLTKPKQVLFVSSGALIMEYASIATERDRQVGMLFTRGQLIGLEYLFLTQATNQSRVTALQESVVLSISIDKLNSLSTQRHDVTLALVQSTAEGMQRLQIKMESLAIYTNYPRPHILATLIELASKIGVAGKGGITVPVKVATLAKLTGLSEDSTRRCSTLLVEAGRIARIGRGHFLVLSEN